MRDATSPAGEHGAPVTADGRATRWNRHRAVRREELVTATIRAINQRGASVGMDDIAAEAGTSKTVFYRHFGDRAGLYRAVAQRVDVNIMRDVTEALELGVQDLTAPGNDAQRLVAKAIAAYLKMTELEPEVYIFVVNAPLLSASSSTQTEATRVVSHQVATQLGALIHYNLARRGHDPAPAVTWGHAIAGMIRFAADHWLMTGATASGVTREELSERLAALVWGGLVAVAGPGPMADQVRDGWGD